MILLDTDIFSLLVAEQACVVERFESTTDEVAITVISRIEVLQGRFTYVLKAADGDQLLRAYKCWREPKGI